tara:strand:+ start:1736 stop:2266 length:531 start_codon:yes stop_codon:yes gene_type:complete
MALGTVATIAGTAFSAYGQMQTARGMKAAGRAAMQTAEYNKKIRDRNARVAEQEADLRERVGGREVVRFRKQFDKLQARAGTAYRKSGVLATTGTPLDVLRESADEAEEDIQTIRLTAATDAGRMRQQGVNQRLAGQLTLLEGRQQQLAYNIKARDARISALTTLGRGAYQVSQIV